MPELGDHLISGLTSKFKLFNDENINPGEVDWGRNRQRYTLSIP